MAGASGRTKVRRSKPTRAARQALVKATRVKTRAQIGTLSSNLVRPYTRKVYWDAVVYFFHFLALFSLDLPLFKDDMDDLLCQAIEHAWHNGEARALASNMISGLELSLIHISEPTRLGMISYAVFCLKKKKH